MNIALFPGSFDPITIGHMSLIRRALPLFDKVYVAIGANPDKKPMFHFEDRYKWCEIACKNMFPEEFASGKLSVTYYHELTADFCKKAGANYIIRGLRGGADFEYENMIYHANKIIHPDLETMFFITESELVGVSSSVVRQIYSHNGDVSKLIPEGIELHI